MVLTWTVARRVLGCLHASAVGSGSGGVLEYWSIGVLVFHDSITPSPQFPRHSAWVVSRFRTFAVNLSVEVCAVPG
jgi:hypothetical protein